MKKIVVSSVLQLRYTYELSVKAGEDFQTDFKPHLTPKEMLELGVFGGAYFEGEFDEFPKDWLENAKLSPDHKEHKELNFFNVKASQARTEWERKGWIHKDDPRGWFQWYCRYYLGRRHEDDERQIKRWKAITRHASQVVHNCLPGDIHCRPRQRQVILHWAYDSRKL